MRNPIEHIMSGNLERLGVAFVMATAVCGLSMTVQAAEFGHQREVGGGKIRLLILSGANNHDWKSTTPVLKKMYEESGHFTVDVTENVPGLSGGDFAKYDALVSNYTTFPNVKGHRWPAETEKAFLEYIAAGHGLVLFHAASTAWNDWPEFTDLIGLSWQMGQSAHGAYHSFVVSIVDHEHPVTKGMKDFQHLKDELYHRQLKHGTAKVLATAYSDKAKRRHRPERADDRGHRIRPRPGLPQRHGPRPQGDGLHRLANADAPRHRMGRHGQGHDPHSRRLARTGERREIAYPITARTASTIWPMRIGAPQDFR